MDKTEKALDFMKKAISLDPEKRILYVNLSNIYDKAGKHREAVFYKRVGTGSLIFKSKKEHGSYKIDRVKINETTQN